MKLISLNVEEHKNYDRIFNFLKTEKPDIVCLYELLEDALDRFKEELGMDGIHKVFEYSRRPSYEASWGKRKGTAILARKVVGSGYTFYAGKEENINKPFTEFPNKGAGHEDSVLVWADVEDANGKIFKFCATHLPVTSTGESSSFQLESVDALLGELDNFPEFILCGDLNAPRGKETFSRIARKYKDDIPKEYETSMDINIHRVGSAKFMYDGMHTYMIEGLFTTPAYKASNVKLVDGVSDHMAVVAEIEKN